MFEEKKFTSVDNRKILLGVFSVFIVKMSFFYFSFFALTISNRSIFFSNEIKFDVRNCKYFNNSRTICEKIGKFHSFKNRYEKMGEHLQLLLYFCKVNTLNLSFDSECFNFISLNTYVRMYVFTRTHILTRLVLKSV